MVGAGILSTQTMTSRKKPGMAFWATVMVVVVVIASLLVLVLLVPGTSVGHEADGGDEENVSVSERRLEATNPEIYRVVFQTPEPDEVEGIIFQDVNAETARTILETFLLRKIDVVDRICHLQDEQKEKLRLAGRGETARLFASLEKMAMQWEPANEDPERLRKLVNGAKMLRAGLGPYLSSRGPFGKTVLLKFLESNLTPEQWSKYEPVRFILTKGGKITTTKVGASEGLQIELTSTGFTDGDLARLTDLSGIASLLLCQNEITDAGLHHLKGMSQLRTLCLHQTRVSAEGAAELKRALPQLEISRSPEPITVATFGKIDIGMSHSELHLLLGPSQFKIAEMGIVNGPDSYSHPGPNTKGTPQVYLRQQWSSRDMIIVTISGTDGRIVCKYSAGR